MHTQNAQCVPVAKAEFFVFFREEDKFVKDLKDCLASKDIIPEIKASSEFSVDGKPGTQKKLRFEVHTELWIRNFAAYIGLEYTPNDSLYILTR